MLALLPHREAELGDPLRATMFQTKPFLKLFNSKQHDKTETVATLLTPKEDFQCISVALHSHISWLFFLKNKDTKT